MAFSFGSTPSGAKKADAPFSFGGASTTGNILFYCAALTKTP